MTDASPAEAVPTYAVPPAKRRFETLLGRAALLAGLVLLAGSSEITAPWLLGDEYIFIVDNPDVNPLAAPEDERQPLLTRLGNIVFSIHEDLYQPVPILTYAIEVATTGGVPTFTRLIDLFLHALNALLLWWILTRLLTVCWGEMLADPAMAAYPLALIWALHPALSGAYAGDMGRTHLLSGLFSLLALGAYQHHLDTDRKRWFAVAVAALVIGMLCKPMLAWFLIVFGLEGAQRGWRGAAQSPRVWLVTLICVFFAGLTYYTTTTEGLAEEASAGLFGDPVSRSALAVSLYFRSIVVPLWISFWQLPDPLTGWNYSLVWSGLGLFLVTAGHAAACAIQQNTRWATFAWLWFWSGLLPVLGLFGAREAASNDRYLYQPLMGIAMLFGWLIGYVRVRTTPQQQPVLRRAGQIVAVVLAVAFGLLSFSTVGIFRSPIQRARSLVLMNPDDPRAMEAFAAALDFAQNHVIPETDRAIAGDRPAPEFFREAWHDTLVRTIGMKNLAYYFPGPEDRAPFHRRLAYRLLRAGDPERSLQQAIEAWRLQPNHFSTWLRIAHAQQALFQYGPALEAYLRAEAILEDHPPENPQVQATLWTNIAYLLLFDLERDEGACERLDAAYQTGQAPQEAFIGLALCHIRYGDSAMGFRLITEALQNAPKNTRANLVLAEYYTRREQWDEAISIYRAILTDLPTEYATLRALHEACLKSGRIPVAVAAWDTAAQHEPNRPQPAAFRAWAMAIADDPNAARAADELLLNQPNHRFACLAHMLLALRAGDPACADEWLVRAAEGQPLPQANEFARAAATLQVLGAANQLPPEWPILFASTVVLGQAPLPALEAARDDLLDWLAEHPENRWRYVADSVLQRLSDAERSFE